MCQWLSSTQACVRPGSCCATDEHLSASATSGALITGPIFPDLQTRPVRPWAYCWLVKWIECSRVPRTRMCRTAVCVILRRPLTADLKTFSEEEDPRLADIAEAVVQRRLQKLEGLRAYQRQFRAGCSLLRPQGRALHVDIADIGSEAYRAPVTMLDKQQTLLLGRSKRRTNYFQATQVCLSHVCLLHAAEFIKLTTQLMLGILLVGPDPLPLKVRQPQA